MGSFGGGGHAVEECCPQCSGRIAWGQPGAAMHGHCELCGHEVSVFVDWPPDMPFPRIRLVARWRDCSPTAQELAALRVLLAAVQDRPLSELAKEARGSTGWVLGVFPPEEADAARLVAERAGLVVEVQQGTVTTLDLIGPAGRLAFTADAPRAERLGS